jgi:Zn finger protein HypA/HybF involved in hydrogenase expression
MNVSTRPDCKRCKTPLDGEVIEHITVCPSCGKRWELTPDCLAIKSITLEVQDAQLITVSTFKIGDSNNG